MTFLLTEYHIENILNNYFLYVIQNMYYAWMKNIE